MQEKCQPRRFKCQSEHGEDKSLSLNKNKLYEGEVLYPPFSKFRVVEIETGDSQKTKLINLKDFEENPKIKAEIQKLPKDAFNSDGELDLEKNFNSIIILSNYLKSLTFNPALAKQTFSKQLLDAGFDLDNLPTEEALNNLKQKIVVYQKSLHEERNRRKATIIRLEEI